MQMSLGVFVLVVALHEASPCSWAPPFSGSMFTALLSSESRCDWHSGTSADTDPISLSLPHLQSRFSFTPFWSTDKGLWWEIILVTRCGGRSALLSPLSVWRYRRECEMRDRNPYWHCWFYCVEISIANVACFSSTILLCAWARTDF